MPSLVGSEMCIRDRDTIVNNLLDNSQVSSTPVESDPSLTSSSSSDVLDSLNQAVDINNL